MTSNHSAATPDAPADRLGRLGRGAGVPGRQAVLPGRLRVFHQHVLGVFLTETGPPDASMVAGLGIPRMLSCDGQISTDPGSADTYLRAHPGMTATLFGQAEAMQAFGGLLDPPHPQEIAP